MSRRNLASLIVVAVLTAGAFVACSEEPPVAPGGTHHMPADVAPLALEPFTFRAPLDPYQIHQLPDFLIHSNARKDIVIQRAVFAPGPGPWHTHPGPSFVYVIEGEIKVEMFTKKEGCTETQVFVPGNAYAVEVADMVHRAVVVSAEPAVLMVTRFNIPVGQPFTIPAADPGC
jgi:quercetin dioxygenase-like cupin family protein